MRKKQPGKSDHAADIDPSWHIDDTAPLEEYPDTKMTGWYDPTKLAGTAMDIVTSALLGVRGDYRIIEALATPQRPFDYRFLGEAKDGRLREEMWLDAAGQAGRETGRPEDAFPETCPWVMDRVMEAGWMPGEV